MDHVAIVVWTRCFRSDNLAMASNPCFRSDNLAMGSNPCFQTTAAPSPFLDYPLTTRGGSLHLCQLRQRRLAPIGHL